MKKDVSVIVPSIRPNNLIKFYESVLLACKKHTFEIIIPSPYLIPESLMKSGNVTFLHTYANPTICFQMAALLCNSEFIYNVTDDGLITENSLDMAIEMFRGNLNRKDSINMHYKEGVLDSETLNQIIPNERLHETHNSSYWYAHTHGDLRLSGIDRSWKICPHFFMKLDYFLELGGYECIFEYSNHSLHDLAFRMQANGGLVYDLPQIAFLCSHLPGNSSDHGPVVEAQNGPDIINFFKIYSEQYAAFKRINLKYDSWKNYPNIWERRFNKNDLKINK